LFKLERTEPHGHRIHHQELGNPGCVIAAKGTALRNDDKKVPANFAWMRKRAFCEAPNENIVELLEKRFSDYLVDPSQGQPADDAFARLAEHKRQWK
jgi:hypothetical protein